MMRAAYLCLILMLHQVLIVPHAFGDDLTDAFQEIKKTLAHPENGLASINRKIHSQYVQMYFTLLESDLTYSLLFASEFQNSFLEAQVEIQKRVDELRARLDSFKSNEFDGLTLEAAIENLALAHKLQSDSSKISGWMKQLEQETQALLHVVEKPCEESRMAIMSESLDASRLFQRPSISRTNFDEALKSMMADLMAYSGQLANTYQMLDRLNEYAIQREDYSPPFYFSASYSTDGSTRFSEGSTTTGILSTVSGAAISQSLAMTAGGAAATTTSMALMTVGLAAGAAAAIIVIYCAVKILGAILDQMKEEDRQDALVSEINQLISDAVPGREESKEFIFSECQKQEHNDLIKASLPSFSEDRSSISDIQGIDQLVLEAKEIYQQVYAGIPRLEKDELKDRIRSQLLDDRRAVGHERMFVQRAKSYLRFRDFSALDENPLLALERRAADRAFLLQSHHDSGFESSSEELRQIREALGEK